LSLISELKLENSVEFTDVLLKEDWHKKSEDYDIFINTTNFDNTPVSVMEAMALGLPVVSTNVGGMPFLINNEIDGILVEKNSVDKMTNAIIDILERQFAEITLNARKKVENFGWNKNKDKWIKLIK
jgi:glycosyltransferase involved in cell wall biosynthesis